MRYLTRLLILLSILLSFSTANADWKSLSTGSGQVAVASLTAPATASGIAVTGACAFHGIVVTTDGANDITINIFDNTAASGTRLLPTDTIVRGINRTWTYELDPAIWCTTGIYVEISVAGGGSCSWQVHYDQ